jgi:hypothetical protein
MSAGNRRNPVHLWDLRGTTTSRRPVALQRGEHFGRPEADGPAQLEGRDHPCNPPLVELAAAHLEQGGHFGLGQEFKFVARRGWVRVHAGAEASTRRPRVVTNGDNRKGDSGSLHGAVVVNSHPLPAVTTVTKAPADQPQRIKTRPSGAHWRLDLNCGHTRKW